MDENVSPNFPREKGWELHYNEEWDMKMAVSGNTRKKKITPSDWPDPRIDLCGKVRTAQIIPRS